ncbi:Phosphoribosyl-AMP cyclohydrolase [Candidatus Hodgkinia cicadicola]|nr:Phosphoribosyl-AMP cyclohydrolase [Candidatus Hodgkinia cicadicola]
MLLIPVIVVDHFSKRVLMLAFTNVIGLRLSFVTSLAHYYSRARERVWLKGLISGNVHRIVQVSADCDSDSLLFSVVVGGGGDSCHTLRYSCFYKKLW